MKIIKQYLKELYNNGLMNNYEIRPSPIHGNGIFATKPIRKGDFVNTHFKAGYDITDFGKHLNHSNNPNARSIKQDDESFKTYAERDIDPDDEITLDYTQNTDLEQPQDDWNIQERVFIKETPESDKVDETNEGGSETVYGAGSNPNPEDETYLSLLKGTTSVKTKVTVKE